MTLRALIWDVDGTLAETERDGHRVAFNEAFAAAGLDWRWSVERYAELLSIAGGRERLLHDMATHPDAPAAATARDALARALHERKNTVYAALVASGRITLRPGVPRLMREARGAGAQLAIASTTSRANVRALLAHAIGPQWDHDFAAIVCAEDAPSKKPHPMVYAVALERLGMAPHEALAIEDSPNGAAAAVAAGVPVLVTFSAYFASFDTRRAIACSADLDEPPKSSLPVPAAPRVDWPWLRATHAQALAAASAAQSAY
jgi:HAD superfamily hydrolase (TIGR01509 family)